jgi:Tol biopolymer transport system component
MTANVVRCKAMKLKAHLPLCLLSAVALTAMDCSKKPTQPPQAPEPIYPPFEEPDETIIFVSTIDGSQWNLQPGWNLFLMNSDGSNITPRTSEKLDSDPAWSFDREKIVFTKGGGSDTSYYHIYTMKNDGSELKCLTPSSQYTEGTSCWSPDMSTICFNRVDLTISGIKVFNLWLMDSNGTNQRQLTYLEHGAGNQEYSPDGTKIVFDSGYLGMNGFFYRVICIMNADGSNIQYITPNQPADTNITCQEPAWSPDGTKIAYSCWLRDTMAIWIMNPDGTDKVKLSQKIGDVKDYHPSWSPDRTRICFQRKERNNGEITSNIWMVNVDGTNQHQITFNNQSHKPSWR